MKIEIKNRYTNEIILCGEYESIKDCLEKNRIADLSSADLSRADLSWANLSGADLSRTILDPTNKPNCIIDEFEKIDDVWVYGYRTRATSAAGKQLQDDRIYGTEVFSTCDTECHPGWYLWPTLKQSIDFSGQGPYIKVKSRICDIHKAGNKWRSRTIWTIGEVEVKEKS
jgi:hypothetical protein